MIQVSIQLLQAFTNALPETKGKAQGEGRAGEQSVQHSGDEVIRLLADCDGYTWQGHIVDALGWSEAKTSRKLSALEDERRITRYRVGRRNVVCLPHREPAVLQQKAIAGERR